MGRRAAALISPGFKKRKIPRELLLDPPRKKRRWWLWLPLAVLSLAALLFAIDAAAREGDEEGSGRLFFSDDVPAIHLGTEVSIRVTGIVARTELRQRFTNQTDVWQEAVYVFPLPDQAAVNYMQMQIGERVITATVEERERARQRYEQARAEGRQAALTEQERPNLFTQSVANIAPGETIEIVLRYLDIARYRSGSFSLRVPLTITPRYVPDADAPSSTVADAHRITPPILPVVGDANRATLTARLTLGYDAQAITSDYHRIVPSMEGGSYRVRLAEGDVPMDRDFVLRWRPVAGATPTATLYTEHVDGHDYGLLTVLPPASTQSVRLPRDMIFVIDTSGSMKGVSMRQARAALQRALEVTLGPRDSFNIIEFDSDYRQLFPESRPVSTASLSDAMRFVDGLKADGGTEMAPPLRAALRSASDEQRLKHIVFMTDGAVGNEKALFQLIHDHLGSARLFTVGIGSAPNSFFMRKAAAFGGGTFTFIGEAREVGSQIESLFEKLERPRANQVAIDWQGSSRPDVYPERIPALYDSEPVVVVARSEQLHGEANVSASLGGEPWETRVPVLPVGPDSGIGTLWARRRIEALEDSLIRGSAVDTVRNEIIDVAMTHQLVSRFTSLVAVETYISRMPGDSASSTAVANGLAKGQIVQLPQTATHANLALLLALLSLAAAALLATPWRRE